VLACFVPSYCRKCDVLSINKHYCSSEEHIYNTRNSSIHFRSQTGKRQNKKLSNTDSRGLESAQKEPKTSSKAFYQRVASQSASLLRCNCQTPKIHAKTETQATCDGEHPKLNAKPETHQEDFLQLWC
jgi:hypothetical protein